MAFFNWCTEENYLKINPMKQVELTKVPKIYLRVYKEFPQVDLIKEEFKLIKQHRFVVVQKHS